MAAFRILSIDGGGIRGLIPAVMLKRLEDELGGPLNQHFDLITGTSSGAITACGVALGLPADTMIDLYQKRGADVFSRSKERFWKLARRMLKEGISSPKYDGQGLTEVLKDTFGEHQLGDVQTDALLLSYDVFNRRAWPFKSYRSLHQEIPLWEVCRASSSAPTYFPSHILKTGVAEVPLADGAMVANNPSACAMAEAARLADEQGLDRLDRIANMTIVSLGTGASSRHIGVRESQEWGWLEWAMPMIRIMFDGDADAADYICRQMLAPGHYIRMQPALDQAYDEVDETDPQNLNAIMSVGQAYLATDVGEAQLAAIKTLLAR